MHGHEVETWQPCGSQQVYWLRGEVRPLGELRARHRTLTERPYAAIFAVLRVRPLPPATDGFAADYDGQVHVEQLFWADAVIGEDCERRLN